MSLARAPPSSGLTCVRVTEGQAFMGTRCPFPALPLITRWGPHLTTQDRQEDQQLNGIHVTCTHYQLNLLAAVGSQPGGRQPLSGAMSLPATFFSAQANDLCFFPRLSAVCGPPEAGEWPSAVRGRVGSQETLVDASGDQPLGAAAGCHEASWRGRQGPLGLESCPKPRFSGLFSNRGLAAFSASCSFTTLGRPGPPPLPWPSLLPASARLGRWWLHPVRSAQFP